MREGGVGTDKANRNDRFGSNREAVCYGYRYAKVKAMKYTRWANGVPVFVLGLKLSAKLGSGGQLLPIRGFSVKGRRRGCVCLLVEQNQDRAEGIIRSCCLGQKKPHMGAQLQVVRVLACEGNVK